MTTIKSFTSVKQSCKLAEILPLESADMFLAMNGTLPVMSKYIDDGLVTADETAIPCWSLAALLGVLPDELEDNHFLTLYKETYKEGSEYCCCYEDCNGNSFKHTFADNPIDACVEMIEKLHELNLL